MKTTEEEYWRENWQNAHRVWGHESAIGKEKILRRSRMLIDLGGIKKGMRILELGCGTGEYSQILAKTGGQLTATDLMEEFVGETRRRIGGIRVRAADGTRLPFKNKCFEAVVGNSVLHHLPDIEKGLAEIYRVLVPAGRMVFTEPNMVNPHIFLQKNVPFLKRLAGDSPDETAFVRWRLAKQMTRVGFVQVEVVPFDFEYPRLPMGLIRFIRPMCRMGERVPILREFAGSVVVTGSKLR